MKSFHFNNLSTAKVAIPLGVAIVCLFVSFFEILEPEPSKLNKILNIVSYGIITVHFIKSLWYNYYVSYNKKAVTIRLSRNILQERTYQFKHLKKVEVNSTLIYLIYREKPEELDVSGFSEDSITKLLSILKQEQ